jgi:hypothetical protein
VLMIAALLFFFLLDAILARVLPAEPKKPAADPAAAP